LTPKRRARRAVLLDLFEIAPVALVALEVRQGGIEEQQIDLEVQQIGGRPIHLLGQLRLDLQQPVHIQRLRILTDRIRGQPGNRDIRHQPLTTRASHSQHASFENGASARLATIANNNRSARGSSLRSTSSRSIVPSIPNCRHNPSSAHAPPSGTDRTNSSSAGAVAINACSGSKARESDRTNLASATRSS
jgi:hypothetical protein